MKSLAIFAAVPLAGCMTTMAQMQQRPIVERVVSSKSIEEIERCIVYSQPGPRHPTAFTHDGVRELSFSQDTAGVVMLFEMRKVPSGTEVTFQRKSSLVDFDDAARACYGGGRLVKG